MEIIKEQQKFEKIKLPFLTKKKSFLFGLLGTYEVVVEPEELLDKEPILLYIDENQGIKPYFNVNTGIIEPKTEGGKRKGYYNEIVSKKRCIFEYGGVDIPVYIQFEKEALPYPVDPVFDAEHIGKVIKGLQLNYEDLDRGEGSFFGKLTMSQVKTILYFIGGIGVIFLGVAWVGKTFGIWELLFPAKEIAKQVISNATTNVGDNLITTIP